MRKTAILLAGLFVSLAAFATTSDPFAEERFRMKTGRQAPVQGARQKAPECCRYMKSSFKNEHADAASIEARFHMKYGRTTPAAEAREKAAAEETALHVRGCVELGKCALMRAEATATTASSAAPRDSGRDARFRMKLGRSLEETPAGGPVVASADRISCEHECCKHAD